jgi:hypothetical protein
VSGDQGTGAPQARTPLGVRLDRPVMHWASPEVNGARIPSRASQGKHRLSYPMARVHKERRSEEWLASKRVPEKHVAQTCCGRSVSAYCVRSTNERAAPSVSRGLSVRVLCDLRGVPPISCSLRHNVGGERRPRNRSAEGADALGRPSRPTCYALGLPRSGRGKDTQQFVRGEASAFLSKGTRAQSTTLGGVACVEARSVKAWCPNFLLSKRRRLLNSQH